MKRDMDLIRAVLIEVEKLPYDGGFHHISVEGHSEEEVTYHVLLAHEHGLIDAANLTTMDGVCWKPKRLTYQGHEFLDSARSDTVWNKAKEKLLTTTGTITLEALKVVLPQVMIKLACG
ncbi:MAG: DUF2513 domain-containing protein [Terriglobia bacterium]|jgi:hypothetical protein